MGGWSSQSKGLHLKTSAFFACFVNKTGVVCAFLLPQAFAGWTVCFHSWEVFSLKGSVFSLLFFWS